MDEDRLDRSLETPDGVGGTDRRCSTGTHGAKTPRKVQWASNLEESDEPRRHLDEEGLDPDAFHRLTSALERHKTSRLKPSQSSQQPQPIRTDDSRLDTESSSPLSTPSPSRVVPGEAFIEPLESEGLPAAAQTEISAGTYTEPADARSSRSEIKALKLVKAHSRGLRFLPGIKTGGKKSRKELNDESTFRLKPVKGDKLEKEPEKLRRRFWPTRSPVRQARQEYLSDADTEQNAQRHQPRGKHPLGAGVLSSLLALYDKPSQSGLSSSSSDCDVSSQAETDPFETAARNASANSDKRATEEHRERIRHLRAPSITVNRDSRLLTGSTGPSEQSSIHQDVSGASLLPNPTLSSTPFLSYGLGLDKLSDALSSGGIRRPAQARNAGGVFGTLIASTGNLSGAAAPGPSSVGPNPTRPGYRLARYSHSGDPVLDASPKASHRTSMATSIASRASSIPPSPTFEPADKTSGAQTPSDSGHSNSRGGSNGRRNKWNGVLRDLPPILLPWSSSSGIGTGWGTSGSRSTAVTPDTNSEAEEWLDEKKALRMAKVKDTERRKKRKKAEIYITRHVAQIIQRHEFILKLARAFMMFGAPSHRLQSQIYTTARVLDVELSCMYLPDMMLISFEDSATSTSNIKFIKQASALNLNKLQDAYELYWMVIHDEISVSDASRSLDALMRSKSIYSWWQLIIIGGFCSSAICSVSFSGSFIDSLISFPLGALLVSVQLASAHNELYSNVFEISIATLLSFLSAALASTRIFCYSAIASSSVVLILPGFIVLCGSLELSSRNIVSGAVRLCFAVMYALFLGFGLAIGANVYEGATGQSIIGPEDYSCMESHNGSGPWWQKTASGWFAFLTVPMFALFMSLRNYSSYKRKELPITVAIACIGWSCNHFSALRFENRNSISSAIGAFAVGFVANLYGRFFSGNAFVIMITGILFQLPSGLGNGGLLTFAEQQNSGSSTSFLSGFKTALQLVSVSIGLTVGLGISLVVVHPVQSRRRASAVFSL